MNKVAKHYGFFMRTIGPVATASGARDKLSMLTELEREYPPKDGWEISFAGYTGNPPEGFTWGVWLTQYEYVE